MRHLLVVGLAIAWLGCGPGARSNNGDDAPPVDGTEPVCSDGQLRCNLSTYELCSNGQWTTQEECPITCNDALGCVQCQPNENVCQDGNVHSCDATGMVGGEVEACTGMNICEGGTCVDACANAAMNKSYIGCEYWAADLDNAVEVIGTQDSFECLFVPGVQNVNMQVCANAGVTAVAGLCDPPGDTCPGGYTCQAANVCVLNAQASPFAIVVSNPQARAVMVTVTAGTGQTFTQSVAAGQVATLSPQMNGIVDQSIDGTGMQHKAYKVTSELPIVAYQFNPLDNVNVFSNDASLLIPRTAWDIDYFAMSWPTEDRRTPAPGNHAYHGYLAIVAHEDGTVVEVTPTGTVRASATQTSIAAGTPTMFTLAAHDVLTLQAAPGQDLTGTKVTSVNGTTTYGVWGGHEAMGFGEMTPPDAQHTQGPCCADHVEDMLFPTSTWGKSFAIVRSQSRGTNEPDMLRIMAQKPGTTLTFDPPPIGTCPTLGAGEHCQVKIMTDTSILASEPVLIGHYLESAIWSGALDSIGEGDPSMAIAVPTEQYRTDYTILVPAAYVKNFMSISAPAGGAVLVDGLPIQLTPFANGTFRAARHMVNAGQHKISCPSGCGVVVYGYSNAVSYMFAGGLDLKQIVIN